MNPVLLALGAAAALITSGALGSVESAVTSISRARVEELVKDERPGAVNLLQVVDRRADHINLLVLLRTLLESTAAVCTGALAFQLIDSRGWALVAAIGALTLVTYVVVGVYSRTIGRQNPYTVSLKSALMLSVLAHLLGPVTKVLIWLGNILAPGAGFRDGPFNTEVELREMVDIAQEHGIVEIGERRMIQSVFDLASTTARSVMVPRPEMIWIESDKTAGQATALCVRSGFSRIPVVGENVDDIVGVVYLKDLVQRTYSSSDNGHSVSVVDVMRPVTFVPDSKNLDDLLREMQLNRNHIALLVDEYGGIAGLISIEDILEEIVGEIADEYDSAEVAPIEKLDSGRYRVVSRLTLEDLADLVDEDLDIELEFGEDITDQVETVSGLIAYELGRVPLPGATVQTCGLELTAEGGRDRRGRMRVRSVIVTVLDRETASTDDR
ncbi:hemolysin family protein [Corynebacterium sp. CCM 9185]|uniref:HlyC/CorC family transporter n=1 Tax=Corynebacterium marambiense TaxID=2765364 RepID=A0ABS0VW47_9CORY|nr:hemolysin family protein [Corynebacterium marambiense]MBI9000982.1 HlyC/CorC family transporter [Corynebacterium marambiense]MCK7662747.1 hemolysin family protein [Corynebacterium marambiense]MCX7543215.1 hemolysin family protein [Corynebacterium marambiense]